MAVGKGWLQKTFGGSIVMIAVRPSVFRATSRKPRANALKFPQDNISKDVFKEGFIQGGGVTLLGNTVLGRVLAQQAQGDAPEQGEVLRPGAVTNPVIVLAER